MRYWNNWNCGSWNKKFKKSWCRDEDDAPRWKHKAWDCDTRWDRKEKEDCGKSWKTKKADKKDAHKKSFEKKFWDKKVWEKDWCKPVVREPDPCEPANQAPEITGPTNPVIPVTMLDTDVVADVDAFDPEGDTLIFALEGEDAARFNIDAETGEIDLMGAALQPHGSANGDSLYEVTVSVTDGTEGNVDTIDLVFGYFSGG